MAERSKQETHVTQQERDLRGGTEGGDASRAMDVNMKGSGTTGLSAPSGDVHVETPGQAVPRTDLVDRAVEDPRLFGGKTPEMIRGYLAGVSFPAKKDDIVRAARRNGAPEDVIGAMNQLLSRTEYASFDELLSDYPRLPDRDDVEPNKGKT